ncbi:fatty acid-binding protein, liver [Aplysia californica]|uniref:Fatty acid-binding protein, liver n=1 Tax=Aplysia californica TaxID=6500 RepID=A0ABM0JE97_APLCA|nr:fatty acid-binding protein, liver [Aplysia californica]
MVDKLFGYWKLEKNENFDKYMVENKVNMVLRKVGNTITSYEEISREDDQWTINITSTFKSTKLVFKLGEPFEEKTMDGRTMKSTFSIEGDTLVCLQDPIKDGDIPSRFVREVNEDGKMVLTCIAIPTNVVAKRYFQPCQK